MPVGRSLLEHGQDVAGQSEPGDRWAVQAPGDSAVVCLELGLVVDLEPDACTGEPVDGLADSSTRKLRTVNVAGTWLGLP